MAKARQLEIYRSTSDDTAINTGQYIILKDDSDIDVARELRLPVLCTFFVRSPKDAHLFVDPAIIASFDVDENGNPIPFKTRDEADKTAKKINDISSPRRSNRQNLA